jgi:hypothetical protein
MRKIIVSTFWIPDNCTGKKICNECIQVVNCTWANVDPMSNKFACVPANTSGINSSANNKEQCGWLDVCLKQNDCVSCTKEIYETVNKTKCEFDTKSKLCTFVMSHVHLNPDDIITDPSLCKIKHPIYYDSKI